MTSKPTIIYTKTDEAPALATYSLLPIIQAFSKSSGIAMELRDISLGARILSIFADVLKPEQRVGDELAALGKLATTPEANIIKLPNISASVPQLKAAIEELQRKGFAIPDLPEMPTTDAERDAAARYAKVMGSAVNPVLREGNSDRRAPKAVKQYAHANPHKMGAWTSAVRTTVATMSHGDFRHTEKSVTTAAATKVTIEHVNADGTVTVLKKDLALQAGEIIDASVMRKADLVAFLKDQIARAKRESLLFSIHLKATMMKVSDPIIFGHATRTYFDNVFEKHGALLQHAGADPNNGWGDVSLAVASLADADRRDVEAEIALALASGPSLAMVDSAKGITNLHVPSDVIVDASMPAMIRDSGCMWNAEGKPQETLAVLPDSSYAGIYDVVITDCKKNGAYDPRTMGSVSNVGLMAQKAEEYGSHDKTFEIATDGIVRIVDANGVVLTQHEVQAGDIWRACQAKDLPIQDWVKLAVSRARAANTPAVFWLDADRPHDAELIKKVNAYLKNYDTDGLTLLTLSPAEATAYSVERIRRGEDTISVTGNVLRDYLTDLFPILEVGTSAKMLSIVPLMNGGGLFETGAGGSAPKHVQQLQKENHLRWDSLGEFLAIAVSLEHLAEKNNLPRAKVLADTLDEATTKYLLNDKSPSRKVGENDNRGSHFYLALYWAQALATCPDTTLNAQFASIAAALAENETKIVSELNEVQGKAVELGGYYVPTDALASKIMRPSATLNAIIDAI